MNSGPYSSWIEKRGTTWWVIEVGGNWGTESGPFRWWIVAWLHKWSLG